MTVLFVNVYIHLQVLHLYVSAATQRSYAKEGQATDAIVLARLKKKIGNNSYVIAKKGVRMSNPIVDAPKSRSSPKPTEKQ